MGETFAEHQNGQSEQVVRRQLTVLFSALRDARPFVIVYEPAWAISTSTRALVCKPSEAGDRHAFLRDTIAHELGPDCATATTILYGGSVAGPNVAEYLAETDIGGGLFPVLNTQATEPAAARGRNRDECDLHRARRCPVGHHPSRAAHHRLGGNPGCRTDPGSARAGSDTHATTRPRTGPATTVNSTSDDHSTDDTAVNNPIR